ncbi:MAG: hypothetical protein JW719_05270 [Pirellulales bacterium]|nr:hypothetical protein [Pirellulales bacterium]
MSFLSATLLLFLVMDPFGNIPFFLTPLARVPAERRRRVLVRELFFALGILLFFLFCGPTVMKLLSINNSSVGIAGGVVLLLIAIKMIFGDAETIFGGAGGDREPFIVPLATPYVAGPSAIAAVLLLVARNPSRWPVWLGAVFVSWLGVSLLLMVSTSLYAFLHERVLVAIERLMGFILAVIAVNMFLEGVETFVETLGKNA